MKKNYVYGILFGVLSILSSLLLVGLPLIGSIGGIINIIVFLLGLLIVLYLALIVKKDKTSLIVSIIYSVISCGLTFILESLNKMVDILAIGFLMGFIYSCIGLIRTNINKDEYKTLSSFIINGIALGLSIISLLIILLKTGLIIHVIE